MRALGRHLRRGVVRSCTALIAMLAACRSDPPALAKIVEANGSVERTPSAAPPAWQTAILGDRLRRGAGVRTGATAQARLDVRGGGTLRMGTNSVVWLGGAPDAPEQVRLESGNAEVEAGKEEVVIGTEAGPARVRPGGRVRLRRDRDGDQIIVEVGTARIERGQGTPVELAAGTGFDLRTGVARAEAAAKTADAGIPDGGIDDETADDETANDEISDDEGSETTPTDARDVDPQPADAHFAIVAGESAIVHDSSPPSHIRIRFEQSCAGVALVEVRRGRRSSRFLGDRSVVVAMTAGSHRYAVRCRAGDRFQSRARVRGTVRVLRDAGRRRVSSAAPRNTIEADGRRYKVLYQNRRPLLIVRWPDAPRATTYTLTFQSGTRTRTYRAARPEVSIPSGVIDEGSHRFWFSADGKRRSPDTRLILDFDNAAPAAQLNEPSTPDAWGADSVAISGIATEGSEVSVDGVALPLDEDFRFSGRVAMTSGQSAVAVRIAKRGRTVHYYVRRRP